MKQIFLLFCCCVLFCSCDTSKKSQMLDSTSIASQDTIRIKNSDADFELVILDSHFNSWFIAHARPRTSYTQNLLEARNQVWVSEWNNRVLQPQRYGTIYDIPINYNSTTDYGFEVNYMLYNYLTYFQIKYDQKLGGVVPRF